MYYIYGVSAPSLLIESTDLWCVWKLVCLDKTRLLVSSIVKCLSGGVQSVTDGTERVCTYSNDIQPRNFKNVQCMTMML